MSVKKTSEKKVEYLELIYDLIFVYVLGRNNSLLQNVENGFVPMAAFTAYLLSSLAVIQVWNFSTVYTNLYGKNGLRDHLFMFINMYLLYFIGEGIRLHWDGYTFQYFIAWALILFNIGNQYLLKRRETEGSEKRMCSHMAMVLFTEGCLVLLVIPFFQTAGTPLTILAVLSGVIGTFLVSGREGKRNVDFMHLTERAMLYVVFSFGEMIIAVASYFEGTFDFSTIYFSLMSFLIAVGLFLSYEVFYDRICDREKETSGMGYMLVHIFLIFSLNCITTSLEFMQDEAVALMPKVIFLTASFLLTFFSMYGLLFYSKKGRRPVFLTYVFLPAMAFAVLMILTREYMYINIFLSVFYIYLQYFLLRRYAEEVNRS